MLSTFTVLFAFCAIALVVSGTDLSECPDGWRFYPKTGKCFQTVPRSLTYDEAVAECVNRKGMLASVASQAENAFIEGYIESAIPTGRSAFWIGLRCRSESAEHWGWPDGSEMNSQTQRACKPILDVCHAAYVWFGKINWWRDSCSSQSSRHGALCQRKAVASTRVVDQLETALAHSEERIKGLEDRVASMEETEDHMLFTMNALLALIAMLSVLHVVADVLRSFLGQLGSGGGTFYEDQDEEEDQIAQPEEENSEDASFDQLIDDNME